MNKQQHSFIFNSICYHDNNGVSYEKTLYEKVFKELFTQLTVKVNSYKKI